MPISVLRLPCCHQSAHNNPSRYTHYRPEANTAPASENPPGTDLSVWLHIGDAIRSLRTERHLTQEQISVLAGLCQIFHVDYNEFFRNIKLSDMEGTKQK